MIRGRCMERTPVGTVTRRTVTAIGKGLAARAVRRYQATITIMTRSTGVMDLGITGIGQRWRIRVTVCTRSRIYLNKRAVIRRYRRMRCCPT